MTVQFIIFKGAGETNNVYQESHTPTTDANGIIIINIGDGAVNSGIYANINWSNDDYFLNTQINSGSGFTDMGTTGFNAVPYALSAKTAENIFSGDYIDLTNTPVNFNTTSISGIESASNTASGTNATAMGFLTIASGAYSTATGRSTSATGDNATAMGAATTASADYATAMGRQTTASGAQSTAMGWQTEAAGARSTAMGGRSIASGNFSTSMGRNSTSESYGQTTLGTYNVPTTPNSTSDFDGLDRLLVVGNGVQGAASDALVILKNGNATLNGTLTASVDSAPDIIVSGTQNTTSGDDGIISSDPNYLGSDIFLRSYDAVHIQLDYDENETGDFVVQNGSTNQVFKVNDDGVVTAPSFDISQITNAKALVTKEFADANYIDVTFSGDYDDLTDLPVLFTSADETDPKVASVTTNTVPNWDGTSLVDGSISDVDGDIGIGTSSPDPSAQLDVNSTTKGFLPPRMSEVERNSIAAPVAAGLIVWCTNCGDNGEVQVYNGTEWTNIIGGTASAAPALGDFYKGGYIFYLDASGEHGLIAATADLPASSWGCAGTGVGTAAAVGSGQANTTAIVNNACHMADGFTLAGEACDNYDDGTYSDWFLPSRFELQLMWTNLADSDQNGNNTGPGDSGNIGGFQTGNYWSSYENGSNNAFIRGFGSGNENNFAKIHTLQVRPVRAF